MEVLSYSDATITRVGDREDLLSVKSVKGKIAVTVKI